MDFLLQQQHWFIFLYISQEVIQYEISEIFPGKLALWSKLFLLADFKHTSDNLCKMRRNLNIIVTDEQSTLHNFPTLCASPNNKNYDDVIKWKQFPRYWLFCLQLHSPKPVKRLKQQLSKQWGRRWFETLSCSLWRHCNDPIDYSLDIDCIFSFAAMLLQWSA